MWLEVSKILNVNISPKDILTNVSSEKCLLYSIVAFSIYKEWLSYIKEDNWQCHDIIINVKLDMLNKIKMYENINSLSSTVDLLKYVLSNIMK